ncbi:MAG TPA: MORN motif-containing protein [Oscillatoriales cyanobacterium M59_W2019_021]|nr:MAG: MORN motif-containing protein [Cyanobacteria bacterium J055]HIK32728.1 MORN motif-containing protein [Oscillatoriales cyanobacterium M4454_W2019_049]HIK50164.1 MORN motif-containing protein [Oscillatoriales cyanobacterium M59_W2019_021]
MNKLSLLALLAAGLGAIAPSEAIAQDTSTREPQCDPPNLVNGFGQCNYGEGFSYIGNFQNGSPNGRGTLTKDGVRYDGEFVNGLPEGEGRLILPDDSRYEGEFSRGAIIFGAAIYANGDRYEGGFTQISRTEQVTTTVRVGTTLDGEPLLDQAQVERTFYSSQPDGSGRYIFANGNRFEGEFFAGEPYGGGTFYHTTGTTCTGYFFTRNFDGKNCTCIYPNGDRYEGELRQARPHGTGTMIKADGTRISGAFRNGQPVSYSGYGN